MLPQKYSFYKLNLAQDGLINLIPCYRITTTRYDKNRCGRCSFWTQQCWALPLLQRTSWTLLPPLPRVPPPPHLLHPPARPTVLAAIKMADTCKLYRTLNKMAEIICSVNSYSYIPHSVDYQLGLNFPEWRQVNYKLRRGNALYILVSLMAQNINCIVFNAAATSMESAQCYLHKEQTELVIYLD